MSTINPWLLIEAKDIPSVLGPTKIMIALIKKWKNHISKVLSLSHSTLLLYKVKYQDKVLTAHASPSKKFIVLSFQYRPLNNITYVEGASNAQVEQMMKLGIGSMTGNKLFINCRLLPDKTKKKFGVFNEEK